ncbi:paired amphipathic helix [Desarmillaria tabescens]|uniref:Paired amphipathic helix n=1 Tax=Armillaria tabescens TaxID=1929756 RepID=A0AA39JV59_ARMTA|nr:paired amphipathic helix [Desarmillaria tabescens]KAK0449530.1 paired amphipathic helix [Desarmillaria tabescens]
MDIDIKPIASPPVTTRRTALPYPGNTDGPPPKPNIPTQTTGEEANGNGTLKLVTPTSLPGKAAAGPSSGLTLPEAEWSLHITDALSYLDTLRVQFKDNPEVYNHFLDIMKDFRTQAVDIPGTMQRVVRLFHGYPMLIRGFNTFLPTGYRIDLSADPNTVTITIPQGNY